MEPTLIGHWRLAGDAEDASGNGHHGQNWGADLQAPGLAGQANGAAAFDGRASCIVVPHRPSLQLGTDDFSLSVNVYSEEHVDDSIGDIAAKFDSQQRNGFNFGVKRHCAACNSLANQQNLQFGIDDGELDPAWTDCGRPGNAVFVMSLVVHEGDLYDALPPTLLGRVDALLVNAPYVPTAHVGLMPPEARLHEPLVALDGGLDGLAVQRRFAAGASRWLAPTGVLLLETGRAQAPHTSALLRDAGLDVTLQTDDDLEATVAVGRLVTSQPTGGNAGY